MNAEDILNQANRLINQYYLFMDAGDMIIRLAYKLAELEGADLKGEFKLRHKQMMHDIKIMKAHHEKFEKDYEIAFKNYRTWDDMRKDSNTLARIGLLLSDRCYLSEENEIKIESMIKNIPTKNCVKNEIIESFRLK